MKIITQIRRRIIELTYKYKGVHLSSTLSSAEPLVDIFKIKRKEERFVLSNGHAGMALYAVLERFYGEDAEKLYLKNGVHPNRGGLIDCSTGSLGHGVSIALGMAISDPTKNVYVLLSDGEMAEGSVWEALRIMSDRKVKNLKLYFNFNGTSALSYIDRDTLIRRLSVFIDPDIGSNVNIYKTDNVFDFLKGIQGHYHRLSDIEYKLAMEELK